MAYQKELWLTSESFRSEIRDLLNNSDFIVHESQNWSSELEYLQFKVIPELVDDLMDNPANDGLIQRLGYVRDSIINDEIGVAISDLEDTVGGIELHPISKSADGLSVLMILTRPNIIFGLESGDDREELIDRFKEVLLAAASEQRRLVSEKKFLPYSKV